MLPESGAVMLTIMRMVVVFPAPLGPSSPNIRPARTARLSSLTALNSPKLLLTRSNFTVISLVAMEHVRYALLACRYRAMESSGIVIDKLKHIGHLIMRWSLLG